LHAGYSAVGLVEVFSIGLIFSWLLWRTGSLWVPIFCHAVYNILVVLVLRLADLPPPA
jgi:membrane protease YdiL (CAAX protease family)